MLPGSTFLPPHFYLFMHLFVRLSLRSCLFVVFLGSFLTTQGEEPSSAAALFSQYACMQRRMNPPLFFSAHLCLRYLVFLCVFLFFFFFGFVLSMVSLLLVCLHHVSCLTPHNINLGGRNLQVPQHFFSICMQHRCIMHPRSLSAPAYVPCRACCTRKGDSFRAAPYSVTGLPGPKSPREHASWPALSGLVPTAWGSGVSHLQLGLNFLAIHHP